MNILFFGSGKFAVKSLEALVAAGHVVNLVVTQPDKPKGRHLEYAPTDVTLKAKELHLEVFQPQNPNTPDAFEKLKKIAADLLVVIAYGHILKNNILSLAKLYPLNVHASLLPKYRGAAPIHWAIINGEKETGISIMKMNTFMDAGEILLQKHLTIEAADNAQTLAEKLALLAAEALIESIKLIETNNAFFNPQDETKATLAPKLEKKHGVINWNINAPAIVHQIRGLYPWPGAYTYHKGKMIKVFKARALDYPETNPGIVLAISKEKIVIGCKEGAVEIFELQQENGKRMGVRAFTCGYKIHTGEKVG